MASTQYENKKDNIEVQQQEINLENMVFNSKEVEPPLNFYLSSLEEQVRCDLKDSKARITPTKSEGRVLLEIDEDSLQHFLDHLQEKNEGDMQKEICDLKSQLHEAKQVQSPSTGIEFEQQTSIINELHVKLEQVTGEKEALQNEVEAKKMELQQMKAVAKTSVELELESYLEVEKAQSKKLRIEKEALQKEVEAMKMELQRMMAVAKTSVELELESYLEVEKAQSKKLRIELREMAEALKGQEEAAKQMMERYRVFHQAQIDEHRSETHRMAAALKETQDLLQTERHVQQETIPEGDMEIFRNFCQAKVDEQIDINRTLKAALDKNQQDLKTFYLQWQHEKFYLAARQQKDYNYFQSQVHLIAVFRAQEQKAVKQTLERAHGIHQTQTDEPRSETIGIPAVLKEAQDLLETESRSQQKTITEEDMEIFRNFCQAKLDEQTHFHSTLQAAHDKAEQERKYGHLQWQQEKSDLTTQLVEAQADTRKTSEALKETNNLLETERLRSQQTATTLEEMETSRASLVAQQEKAWDNYNAQLKIIASLRMQEEKAKQTLQILKTAHQSQLEEQRVETSKILVALKNTEDLLETERLRCRELETSQSKYLAKLTMQDKDKNTLIATLKKRFEAQLESERFLWQQEKVSLQTDALRENASFKVQLDHEQTKINSLLAAGEQAEQMLTLRTIEWQQEKASLEKDALTEHASFKVQLDHEQTKISSLLAAGKEAEQMLTLRTIEWEQEKASLQKDALRENASFKVQLDHEQTKINSLLAAGKQAEQMLTLRTIEWEQEKASLQKDALRENASFKVQLDHEQTKINSLLAAGKQAEQMLTLRTIEWEQEKASLDQAHLKIIASLRTQEEEATQMLQNTQALHQAQLEDERAETNRIAAHLKNTEELLKLERLCCQELSSLTTELETSKNNCLAKLEMQDSDNKNIMATLKIKFEDQLESEHLLWQQEKASFGVQLSHQKEENNNLLAAVTQAEQLLEHRSIKWQEEKTSLLQATENFEQTLHQLQVEWQTTERHSTSQQTTESSSTSRHEDLQSQMTKQKKKKWYKLF